MFAYNMLRIEIYKQILSVISIVNRKSSNRKSLCVSTEAEDPREKGHYTIENPRIQTQPLPSATRLVQALGRLCSRSVRRSADVRRPQKQDLSERSEFILRGGVNHILHEVFSIVNRKSVNRKSFCFSLLRFFGGAKK